MNNEFYIGWLPHMPAGFAKLVKKFLVLLVILVTGAASAIALLQKKFDTGNFEFGTLTEVKGIYFNKPVPLIKVINGRDIWGNISYETIPFVGYGKHGAEGIITSIEKEKNVLLEARQITIKGTLLYNDGKILMQLSPDEKPLISVSVKDTDPALLPQQKELGEAKVKGEVIDPKCYFGVMKPGEGKVHRDCAIRCILGGIPPVMVVRNEKGEKNYYLLVGPKGEKINGEVQDFVGEPVEIAARLVQYDDWTVMYMKEKRGVKRISGSAMFNTSDILSCVAQLIKPTGH